MFLMVDILQNEVKNSRELVTPRETPGNTLTKSAESAKQTHDQPCEAGQGMRLLFPSLASLQSHKSTVNQHAHALDRPHMWTLIA